MKYKRLLCLLLTALMTVSATAITGSAASGWVTLLEQDSFDTLAEAKNVYTTTGESESSGEMLLQDGKPSLKRLGTTNAGGTVVMAQEIPTLESGKYTIYIDTKQIYQGNYRIYLQDANGTNQYRIYRSFYGDIQVQKAADGSVQTWGPEFRNTGAASEEKALFSLKMVVDADAGTVSTYGKGTPSNATKNPSGCLLADYAAGETDEEGYVTILENAPMVGSGVVAKIAFNLEKSTSASPANSQMTVESIRIVREVDDIFQADKDSLTEDVILNGQDKTAVQGSLNLPQTLSGGTKVTWEAEPSGVVDTDTGEITPPESGSVDVTLTAHLTEDTAESPRTEDVTFQLTVIATKDIALNQTTYDSEEDFLADYTVTGSETDATVSLTDGKPTIVRTGVAVGETVAITRNLPEMTDGVWAIYANVRQAYQSLYTVGLMENGESRLAINRNWFGNMQSAQYAGFTFPCQFRCTADFNDSRALLQYKFIYIADTGRILVYLKGTPTNNQDQYTAMETDNEGYVLFREEAVDIGAGNTINQIMFQSAAGSASYDKANQTGLQVEQVQVYKVNDLDIFTLDADSLTEETILNGQEKEEVREALNLPQTLLRGTTVTWSAEPQGIIDPNTGAVTRPQKVDTTVKLTAEMNEVGGASRQAIKEFTVKVISEETDNPTPDYGWATLLEQPAYANETELKADYIMPSSDDVTTGLYNGAPSIIRVNKDAGADVTMTRVLPSLEEGVYTVYVDTLQAYRGSYFLYLTSGGTARLRISRNHFGNMASTVYPSFTYPFQFRGTGEFNATAALLSFKFVIDADNNTVSIYLKGTPTGASGADSSITSSNYAARYAALEKDSEGYVLFGANLTMTGSGTIDGLEITSTKGASSDTAGKSGVTISGVTVKKQLTSAFESDSYSLTEEVVLNGQSAQEVRNSLYLPTELPFGTTVEWSAQPEGVVDLATGAVTRAEEVNMPVTLTATLTEYTEEEGGDQPRTETKTFQILVLSRKVDQETLLAVEFDAKVLEVGEILANDRTVQLPTHGAMGSSITWTSSSSLVAISNTGIATITAPNANTEVTLTATIAKGLSQATKDFTFTLGENLTWDTTAAANNLTAETVSGDDLAALTYINQLPTVDTQTGAQIEWVSSNTDLLDPQTGTVNRPVGADEMVQLYALITKSGECMRSKGFMIHVLGQRQGLHYFVEETFEDDTYTQDINWTFGGTAQLENEKLTVAGGSTTVALISPAFCNDRYVTFQMEFTPSSAGAIRFLNEKDEVVFAANITAANNDWGLEYNGSWAYTVSDSGNQRFFLDFVADLQNQTLQIKVNGNVLATGQPLPEGANLKTVELTATGTLDNVESCSTVGSDQDSLLQMIVSQVSAAMVTTQPATAVTQNVTLSTKPLKGIGSNWTSSAPEIIALDGTVTRTYGDGADTVTLTAELYLIDAPEQNAQAQIVLQVPQIGELGINADKAIYCNAEPLEGSSLENAVDGSPLSAFITNGFGDATEIMFHLGGEVTFDHIIIQEQQVNGAYNIAKAVVEISSDRSRWTEVAQLEGVGALQDIVLDDAVTATYVRFSFTKLTDDPIAVAELTVARGNALGGSDPQTDLEGIMAGLPTNFYLTEGFTVPLTGASGCTVEVSSSNTQAVQVTKGSEAWIVQVTRQASVDQPVNITITCSADGATTAQKSRTYSVLKTGTSSGSGGGGASGGGSGGSGGTSSGSGGGTAVVPTTPSTSQPTTDQQPATDTDLPFVDMADAQWAVPYVAKLKEMGAVSGDQNGLFMPNTPATREEFVKILVCALGETVDLETDTTLPFMDVEVNAWYYPYLVKAYEMNLIQGVSDSAFGIGQTISRQDMATIIFRLLNPQQTGETESAFLDSSEIADWAKEAVSYLESVGVLNGDEQGYFNPWNATTKAEVAKVVCSILD